MASKLDTLQTCGSILSTKDFNFFALRCAYCERILGQWSSFLEHIGTKHVQDGDHSTLLFESKSSEKSKILSFENEEDSDEVEQQDNENDELQIKISNMFAENKNLQEVKKNTVLNNMETNWHRKEKTDTRALKLFWFDLRPGNTRQISLEFLNLWKKHANNDNNVSNSEINLPNSALSQIRLGLAQMGYVVSDDDVRNTINHVVRKFKKLKLDLDSNEILDRNSHYFLNKCDFLYDHLDLNYGEENVFENNESDINFTDDESNINGEPLKAAEIVDCSLLNRPYKRIRFHIMPNQIATDLINLLHTEPILWDRTRSDYNNIYDRKQILQKWKIIFQERHQMDFSHEDFSLNLQALHRYYNSVLQRKDLNEAAKKILELCNFLPCRTKTKKIKCAQCDSYFLNEKNYKAHLYETHKLGENPFKCKECNMEFKSATILDNHILNIHNKSYKFTCNYCGRNFLRKSQYDAHMPVHTGINRYICETCGKSFRRKINLQYHETRIHLRLRNYACHLCTKAFYTKALLRDHINAHLNIRNHICPTCNKGFHSSHSLMRHKQIHSNVKKYACKLCDARFNQFVGLNSHMKSRHKFVTVSQETPTQAAPILIKETFCDSEREIVDVVMDERNHEQLNNSFNHEKSINVDVNYGMNII